MIIEQLYLFEQAPDQRLLMQCKDMLSAIDKMRKSQFAKLGDTNKKLLSAEQRIEALEHQLAVLASYIKNNNG